MANQHGGYRQPANPAPVSGPGQLARRTDGGPQQTTVPMTGMGYGENADFNDIQSSAPLAAAPSVSNMRARKSSPTNPGVAATPLFSPTALPDEPVTAGSPVGPGPGPSPLPPAAPNSGPSMVDTIRKIYSITGDARLGSILAVAERRGW